MKQEGSKLCDIGAAHRLEELRKIDRRGIRGQMHLGCRLRDMGPCKWSHHTDKAERWAPYKLDIAPCGRETCKGESSWDVASGIAADKLVLPLGS